MTSMPRTLTRPDSPSQPSAATASPARHQRILIVEDNEDAGDSLRVMLSLAVGVAVDLATNGTRALEMLRERPYSAAIVDLRMPKLGGMELLREIQAGGLDVTVIVTTGYGSINEAVEAMRFGAYDFLTKPVDPSHLSLLVQRVLRERSLRDELIALKSQLDSERALRDVVSKNPRMLEIFDLIRCVAETTTTVLVEGETGTGKEMIARAIHQASSATRGGPIVVVNCAALPENLLESELFGHEKGSFTGAARDRKGRFELAHGGTLFLDEVGDIPASMQVKLLRVLQERTFERVGGSETIQVDVRVVSATNRNLESMVKEGKFREDLFYRLNVFKIDLPPLRERPEDIPLLAAHFAEVYKRPGQPPCQFSPEAMELILGYSWPGNIRQLENAIERAVVTARDGMIQPANLPADLARPAARGVAHPVDLSRPLPEQLSEMVAEFEKRYIRRALKKTRGHVGRCARISGLSRRSVTSKIAQYKIDTSQFKQD
ncbi:MAG: sigma-54 dependent transcriptional regulator [Isosphaeraceae bacterium]